MNKSLKISYAAHVKLDQKVESVGLLIRDYERPGFYSPGGNILALDFFSRGQSQNTVPIASTQVAIKGIVQHSTRTQYEDTRVQAVGQQTCSA